MRDNVPIVVGIICVLVMYVLGAIDGESIACKSAAGIDSQNFCQALVSKNADLCKNLHEDDSRTICVKLSSK